jgi:hypothetical protein
LVKQGHNVPAREQGGGDIDPDETGAAKDQDLQCSIPALLSYDHPWPTAKNRTLRVVMRSQQGRTEIPRRIHVRHQPAAGLGRFAT